MHTASVVVFTIGAILANLFVVLYASIAPWRKTVFGQNIMAKGLIIATIMDMSLITRFITIPLFVWVIVYSIFDIVIAWRILILIQLQWNRRRSWRESSSEKESSLETHD